MDRCILQDAGAMKNMKISADNYKRDKIGETENIAIPGGLPIQTAHIIQQVTF